MAPERFEKVYIRRRLVLPRWFASGDTCDCGNQWERIVDHVCCNCEDEPEDRREDAHPSAPRLQSEPEEGAEHASEHCVAAEPEKRVAGTKLQSVRGESVFRVTLSHIQCRLEPIESCADKGPVNNTITHTVVLGAQN